MSKPILSIISPTRENFSDHWITELLKVKGEVEFILVHPPGMEKYPLDEPRLKQINSVFRGEIFQRMTALINASGQYVLSINCDEYLNPEILEFVLRYFKRFPDSWVLRLIKKSFVFGDKEGLSSPWSDIPNLEEIEIYQYSKSGKKLGDKDDFYLQEIPIAPVDNKFNPLCFFSIRKDHHGRHTENFDKKIWKNTIVQESVQDIIETMKIEPIVKYVPFWCLDRLLGLFIQAKFYQKGQIIGHLLPFPEQIRDEENPPEFARTKRFYVFAEMLLLKRFPQYGYFWNLIIAQLVEIPIRAVLSIQRKLSHLFKNSQPIKSVKQ
ncbi:MAG TPA: transposase [Cyanothece sp. UBA12306]|nr:transposase [Cyanothece sp. UBA12306]